MFNRKLLFYSVLSVLIRFLFAALLLVQMPVLC